MKLTKKLEAEALKVIDAYWSNYIKGDVKAMTPLLDENFTQVGSAESEVFDNKKDAVKFLNSTIKEVSGRVQMRNRITKAETLNDFILIHDQCNLYILTKKKWVFYAKFRASSLLQKQKGAWKIVHQHSSFPDTKTEKVGNLAMENIENIAAENQQLRDTIKRRTVELKNKNRELEIEAALERVRSRAMAMQHSDELAILVATVFRELNKLDFSLASCIIWIHSPANKANALWIASEEMNKPARPLQIVPFYPPFFTSIVAAWKAKDPKWVFSLSGTEKKKFQTLFLKHYPELPEALKKPVRENKQIFFSASFNNFGALEVVANEPLTNEKFDILHRFGKVFNSSYTRFNDLKKAEARAREARIEAALERIRSVSMAIQKSDELLDIIHTVFGEWKKLGLELYECNINLLDRSKKEWTNWGTGIGEAALPRSFLFPWFDDPFVNQLYEDTCAGLSYRTYKMEGKDKSRFLKSMFTKTEFKNSPKEYQDALYSIPRFYLTHAYIQYGSMDIVGAEPPPEPTIDILKRFAKVFEQAYTRYLDVVQAETQAREAQIQLALERVRARTMAMQKSDELRQVVSVLFEQIKSLGFDAFMSTIVLYDKETRAYDCLLASHVQAELPDIYRVPYFENRFMKKFTDAFGERVLYKVLDLSGKDKQNYDRHLFTKTDFKNLPEESKRMMQSVKSCQLCCAYMAYGCVEAIGNEPLKESEALILQRFAKVFEQTYTRFLDLKKAEAQAREAQIEASLERIRAKTMAMHNSEDVSTAIAVLFTELDKLGIENVRCGIAIIHQNKTMEVWSVTNVNDGITVKAAGSFDMNAHQLWQLLFDVWHNRAGFMHYFLEGKEKDEYIAILNNTTSYLSQPIPDMPDMDFQSYHFEEGAIWTFSKKPHTAEEQQVMKRFTAVFSLTFRRYQDLQKAEAQARESQIQLALERVRSRAMAMHHTDELSEVLSVLFEQFDVLDISPVYTFLSFIDPEKNEFTYRQTGRGGKRVIAQQTISLDAMDIWKDVVDKWKAANYDTVETMHVPKEQVPEVFEVYKNIFDALPEGAKVYREDFPDGIYSAIAASKFGHLGYDHYRQSTEEEKAILLRFNTEFVRLYQRFLDLQKAEAQAREAQIELSLERVRAKAMAMHHSDELSDVLSILFGQFDVLGINPVHAHLSLVDLVNNTFTFRMTGKAGKRVLAKQIINDASWDLWKELRESFIKNTPGHVQTLHFPKESVLQIWKIFDEVISTIPKEYRPLPEDFPNGMYTTEGFCKFGTIGFQHYREATDEEKEIVRKFATEFGRLYQRFLDLQKAEAQAREAQIEAALERVRSRTMSMQQSDELPEAANNLFLQVQALGIPAWSAGYCIWENEDRSSASLNMSSEGVLQKPFSLPCIGEGYNFYDAYKNGESFYVAELGGEALVKHYQFMRTLPVVGEVLDGIINAGFQLPTFQIFHIVYFTHGYLMFITYEAVPDAWDIFRRFGKVFEQTYTRFLDLQHKEIQAVRLKEEKEKLEQTLGELQVTQKQLIQSEKMASLGELTAGIAHEIQNPLNFVNNFSDVSNELLDEMKHELEKGNKEDAIAIVENVKQNLEKILHHGKRADAIVKGMLQHSRISSGHKEMTDINLLADEYLRLAYHGLRAKDKSFNATMKTDFDKTIGNIHIIPQDIGRAILNLINNAFYAVDEKTKSGVENYEPTVSVNTKKNNGKVEIRVKDNGNGIPQKVLAKIFQPFFTTKPTGQGTGLGLSLSYDIVKAHGGELKVETMEGESSEFVISLPVGMYLT